MSQKNIGLDVRAISSPFQNSFRDIENYNEIVYIRTSKHQPLNISDRKRPFIKRLLKLSEILSFTKKIDKQIVEFKPDILHAHAMFFCGLPCLWLRKKHKIPVVYELRSLWMLEKKEDSFTFFDKIINKTLMLLELFVLKRADKVVVINNNLKDFIIKQGVKAHKISVVMNAVNISLIAKGKEKELVNVSPKNFGYIGTLTSYEGVDLLIKAFLSINKKFPNIKLFIYGSGIEVNQIRKLVEGKINIFFKGAINPLDIETAYNKIDVIVNPRYKNHLTDSVTPLKPLEAMGYNKIFIGSNVGGIMELVEDKFNGFLFKSGNQVDLENKMEMVLSLNIEAIEMLKKTAYNHVRKNRSWKRNALLYQEIYVDLIKDDNKIRNEEN